MFCVPSSVVPVATVTPPASVPPLSVNTSVDPPVLVMVPPLIVPPSRSQAPMAGDRVKVAFALFNVPVRFTVLPLAR